MFLTSSGANAASLGTHVADVRNASSVPVHQIGSRSSIRGQTGSIHGSTDPAPTTIWLAQSEASEADQERFIRAAIAYWIEHDQFSTASVFNESEGVWEERPLELYTSVDEFLLRNTECCRFAENIDGYRPGFWYRYRNDYIGMVSISPCIQTYSDTGEETKLLSAGVYAINRDGKVIEEEFWEY